MPERELPESPNLEQYGKQAKDLVKDHRAGISGALERIRRHHPRFHKLPDSPAIPNPRFTRTDAQLVIAREHGFEGWPKFAKHIETLRLIRSVGALADPVSAFIEVACVPRHSGHNSGSLKHAEMILSRYPEVPNANIYTAAILADESAVLGFLARDAQYANAKGGPHGWDALTHLCFSRYLRLDRTRSERLVRTARALLDAGASAKTGWYETIDHPTPRRILESALYGAAGIAQHPELTHLLLEYGADPSDPEDEETLYHVPEGYDNTVMKIILQSGKVNRDGLTLMLVRKEDWHDEEGLRLLLEHGADPNVVTKWGNSALHHAIRRDNRLSMIEKLLDHAADPLSRNACDSRSAVAMAVHRGRSDLLRLFAERGFASGLDSFDRLIAACVEGDSDHARRLAGAEPDLQQRLIADGGTLLAEFAGNGNVEGIRCLIDLGVSPAALYEEGDPYFDIAKHSTALHVAAWRSWPPAVRELIAHGAPVNALDGKGRNALGLAVKACIDSYWMNRRTPESVHALLQAGATIDSIEIPTGYEEVDELLRGHAQ